MSKISVTIFRGGLHHCGGPCAKPVSYSTKDFNSFSDAMDYALRHGRVGDELEFAGYDKKSYISKFGEIVKYSGQSKSFINYSDNKQYFPFFDSKKKK